MKYDDVSTTCLCIIIIGLLQSYAQEAEVALEGDMGS